MTNVDSGKEESAPTAEGKDPLEWAMIVVVCAIAAMLGAILLAAIAGGGYRLVLWAWP